MILDVIAQVEAVKLRLFGIMQKRGISYYALAHKLGISRQAASELINNLKPTSSINTILKLAWALGAEVEIKIRIPRKPKR